MNRFTTADILKSKVGHLNKKVLQPQKNKEPIQPGGRIVSKHYKKKSKALDWMGWNLMYWANENALILEEEYLFDPERKWRFDWAIPALKIAIEFEGGIFQTNSGHNTAKHYTKDTEKYNSAQRLGWKVLRFTALNYKNAIIELNKIKSAIVRSQ